MKKIFCATAVLITGFFISANAGIITHTSGKEDRKQIRKEKKEKRRELWLHSVNAVTASRFATDFPNANSISWTQGVFEEATFYDGDVLKTTYYDSDNELVGTTRIVDYSMLSGKARHYINNKYPGYIVERVILFDDNESNNTDMVLFSNQFNDGDTYFPILSNGGKKIILEVTTDGSVFFFRNYK